MADKKDRRGLGRGLSALMADVAPAEATPTDAPVRPSEQTIPIDRIVANPDQPRRVFAKEALEELANSIREKGVLQPLILRPDSNRPEYYQIVAGERRWRASQIAQLHDVPAIIREFTDTEVLEVAIIENIQRADLNPVEEAAGYRQLMERFGHTQERMAAALGKSRSYIANALRLLALPKDVLDMLSDGRLSTGHARALITSADPAALAREVVRKGLSVRETEKLAKAERPLAPKKQSTAPTKDADTRLLEQDLSAALGLKVTIDHPPDGQAGTLTIKYKSLVHLDDLCRKLTDN